MIFETWISGLVAISKGTFGSEDRAIRAIFLAGLRQGDYLQAGFPREQKLALVRGGEDLNAQLQCDCDMEDVQRTAGRS
jgi:hypothetical protein